jgi:hypothetical protein
VELVVVDELAERLVAGAAWEFSAEPVGLFGLDELGWGVLQDFVGEVDGGHG